MAYDYQTLQIKNELGVLTATINNPPVNVMTHSLYMDLVGFTSEVEQDESVKVVVFQSADPDFFIAHDLDRENRSLLRQGRLAFVLHHDLRADLDQAFQQITAYHKLRPPVLAEGPADVQIITPSNCPREELA